MKAFVDSRTSLRDEYGGVWEQVADDGCYVAVQGWRDGAFLAGVFCGSDDNPHTGDLVEYRDGDAFDDGHVVRQGRWVESLEEEE